MMQVHDRLCSISQRKSNVCDCYLSRLPKGTTNTNIPFNHTMDSREKVKE